MTITSANKAIVFIKEYATSYRVSIADPLYNQSSISITINQQLTGSGASYAGGVTTITFTMPPGDAAGSTATSFYTKVSSGARIALNAALNKDRVVDISWTPADSSRYYRLKIQERNGRAVYSAVRKVYTDNDAAIKVYPNPAQDFVELRGEAIPAGNTFVRLLDGQGRLIKTVNTSQRPVHIQTNGLNAGKYYLQLGGIRLVER